MSPKCHQNEGPFRAARLESPHLQTSRRFESRARTTPRALACAGGWAAVYLATTRNASLGGSCGLTQTHASCGHACRAR
jgi:hypothetical protein